MGDGEWRLEPLEELPQQQQRPAPPSDGVVGGVVRGGASTVPALREGELLHVEQLPGGLHARAQALRRLRTLGYEQTLSLSPTVTLAYFPLPPAYLEQLTLSPLPLPPKATSSKKRPRGEAAPLQPPPSIPFAAALHKTDIIPAVYEGGFKLWSCAVDLLRYLHTHGATFAGQRVLDVGCGHGLLGAYALAFAGASFVCLQDYNREVLAELTLPTLLANVRQYKPSKVELWAGDWDLLPPPQARELTFEFVVTTDTLYTEAAVAKLLRLLRRVLAVPAGVALVGTKVAYFGCGGGVVAPSAALSQGVYAESTGEQQFTLECEVLQKLGEEGNDIRRQLLRLFWVPTKGATTAAAGGGPPSGL